MRLHFTAILAYAAAIIAVAASPRCVVVTKAEENVNGNKDSFKTLPARQIKPLPETLPRGSVGDAMLHFEPYILIQHGCHPFAAVDRNGTVNKGLRKGGASDGGCRNWRFGQTYTRGAWYSGYYAIMYAWYMPKDQILAGVANCGHKHEWEGVVVWIDNPNNSHPRLLSAAASHHGKYRHRAKAHRKEGTDHVQVRYYTDRFTNHQLRFTRKSGDLYPLVDYDSVDPVVRKVFNGYDWGHANCPFSEANLMRELEKAYDDQALPKKVVMVTRPGTAVNSTYGPWTEHRLFIK